MNDNLSIIDGILTNIAWEAAKSTGIISEFYLETTQKLNHVYFMQELLAEGTITKIFDYSFDTIAHNMENTAKY